MSFNPDQNKQLPEVTFSRKITKSSQPQISFNNMSVCCVNFQKHLGIYLDEKLNFNYHIKKKLCKAMQGVVVTRKPSKILLGNSLITIYKSFVRPLLVYGDDFMIKQIMEIYVKKLREYNVALAITGVIKGTFQMKLYSELGLESLKFSLWFRKLCLFFNIKKHGFPKYLFNMTPQSNHQYNTPTNEDITRLFWRAEVFKYFYFPAIIMEWNQLDVRLFTIF